ncbi:MAG TPA: hypothetical protein PLO23_03550 [Alphaproteobacteria bacterium]|nr:hypothetical protein [Alphaproteobacteria bacterium]
MNQTDEKIDWKKTRTVWKNIAKTGVAFALLDTFAQAVLNGSVDAERAAQFGYVASMGAYGYQFIFGENTPSTTKTPENSPSQTKS